jgi:DNA-binding response OmpR family regulator
MKDSYRNNLILIAEDDQNTASLVSTYLVREGFETTVAGDGEQALHKAGTQNPVLVILDIMLPVLDGWQVCKRLRQLSNIPIIMLTARDEEIDRILGLSLGADDYVVKPFSPRELVERVKAVLRRAIPPEEKQKSLLSYKDLQFDPIKHKVAVDDRTVDLTNAEFKILHALMRAPGKVFTRDELLERIYDRGEVVIDRVIDVHIGKIRQKIGDDPGDPQYIITVRGIGYKFSDQ